MLNDIQVQLEEQNVPDDIGIPIRWDIVTLWYRESGDEGKHYQQSFELVGPKRKTTIGGATTFSFGQYRFQRNIVNTIGFPLFGSGDYSLRLLLSDGKDEPHEVATFPILVKMMPAQ